MSYKNTGELYEAQNTLLKTVATEHKLNLSKASDYQKCCEILSITNPSEYAETFSEKTRQEAVKNEKAEQRGGE